MLERDRGTGTPRTWPLSGMLAMAACVLDTVGFSGGAATGTAAATDTGAATDTSGATVTGVATTSTSSSTDAPTTTDTSGTQTTAVTSSTTTNELTTTADTSDTTTGQTGCEAPSDQADDDGDGVSNDVDNCPCDSNPNQLDFDGDGLGNVCAVPLVFSIVDGIPLEWNALATSMRLGQFGFYCDIPINLIVFNALIQATLDDDGLAAIWLAQLSFADTSEFTCQMQFVTFKVVVEMLVTVGPQPYMVGFPFMLSDHENGVISGMMDMSHDISATWTLDVTDSSNPDLVTLGPMPIADAAGSLPAGEVTIVRDEDQITIEFADAEHAVLAAMTESGAEVQFTGLTGKLRFRE